MGEGLGLDIANSFWFFNANDQEGFIDAEEEATLEDQLSYFGGDQADEEYKADEIICYIRAGWIDTLHSWGDFSRADTDDTVFVRDHAKHAAKELDKLDLQISVWTNHGNRANIQNFGLGTGFADYQQGDVPDSPAYHTDLALDAGIQFIWNSKGSDEVGARRLLFPVDLRDGGRVWGFDRYTHEMVDGEKKWLWSVHRLHRQLSDENLQQIVNNNLYSIMATHLGNGLGPQGLPRSAIDALRRLKQYQDEGKILVASTSRLLQYHRTHLYLDYTAAKNEDGTVDINIEGVDDPVFGYFLPENEQIRGITFEVPQYEQIRILVDGQPLPDELLVRHAGEGERGYVGVSWFAPDYTDYTRRCPQPD